MNFLSSLIFVIGTLCVNGVSVIGGLENYFTLCGQVINPDSSQLSIESGSKLIIELQDISVTHELAATIGQQITDAVVFPIIFNISYTSDQVTFGHLHVLNAKIINKYRDISFVNKKRIEVKLFGAGRTTFIDVPVIPVRLLDYDLVPMKLQSWPELVGKDGDEAVEIIKKQTGYQHVFVVTDESKVTKDLRYDRVCIYVDDNGKVAHVPRPG